MPEKIIVTVTIRDGEVVLVGATAPEGYQVEISQVASGNAVHSRATLPAARMHNAPTVVPPAPDASLPTIERIREMPNEELGRLLNRLTVREYYQLCTVGFDLDFEFIQRSVCSVLLERLHDDVYLTGLATFEAQLACRDEVLNFATGNLWHWLWVRFYDPDRPLPPHRFDELLKPEYVPGLGRIVRLLRIARYQTVTVGQSAQLAQLVREHNVSCVILDRTGAVLVDETIRANAPNPSGSIHLPPGATMLNINDFWERLHIRGA